MSNLTVQRLYDECLLQDFPPSETKVIFTDFAHKENIVDGESPNYRLVKNAQLWSMDGNKDIEYALILEEGTGEPDTDLFEDDENEED